MKSKLIISLSVFAVMLMSFTTTSFADPTPGGQTTTIKCPAGQKMVGISITNSRPNPMQSTSVTDITPVCQ